MSIIVLPYDAGGPFVPYYGSFSANITQNITQNVPTVANFDTSLISNGVSLVAGTQLTVSNNAVYEFSFSPQFGLSAGNKTIINCWIRLNGNDVPATNSKIELESNHRYNFPFFSYLINMTAGQYVEFVTVADTAVAQLANFNAKTNPPDLYDAPSNPALIAIAKRVG